MGLAEDYEILNTQVHSAQEDIATAEQALKELDDKEAAAKELLAEAEKILAGPPQLEVTPTARCDKADAEKALERIAENRAIWQRKLEYRKRNLASLKERKRQFPVADMEQERKLARLRQRCK